MSGSIVLRGGTVLTLDDAHRVLPGADVLVTDDRIVAIGAALEVPAGTVEGIQSRSGVRSAHA